MPACVPALVPALVDELDPCLERLTKLLGDAGYAMGWEANDACCRALSWALTARRCLLFPEGRPKHVGVETRRRPEAPAVPRADPAPAAATAEKVAARVAKKSARNKKKNKARSERRQRLREAMKSGGHCSFVDATRVHRKADFLCPDRTRLRFCLWFFCIMAARLASGVNDPVRALK